MEITFEVLFFLYLQSGNKPVVAMSLIHIQLDAVNFIGFKSKEVWKVERKTDEEAENDKAMEILQLVGKLGGGHRSQQLHPALECEEATQPAKPLEGHEDDEEIGGSREEPVQGLQNSEEVGLNSGGRDVGAVVETQALTVPREGVAAGLHPKYGEEIKSPVSNMKFKGRKDETKKV